MGRIETKRTDFIDVAKAIGIVLVMISHSVGFLFNAGYYFTASYMSLFFFLSGYTYSDNRTVKDNLIRRTAKIGKAYFFYSICLLIMTVISKAVLHSGLSKEYLLTAISGIFYSTYSLYPRIVEPNITFFTIQNAPLWYLTCYIVAGGLFDLAINIVKKHRYVRGTWLIILTGTLATYLLADIPIRLPWGIDTAFAGMAFMAFGYLIKHSDVFSMKYYYCLMIVAFVVYISLCNWNKGIAMSVREYGNHGMLSIMAFIIIGCIGSLLYIYFAKILCMVQGLKNVLCCIGRKTLPILAFHVYIFVTWDKIQEIILQKMGITMLKSGAYWALGILKISITVLICLVGSWCWNKIMGKISERKINE